jgi:hypothetical protein
LIAGKFWEIGFQEIFLGGIKKQVQNREVKDESFSKQKAVFEDGRIGGSDIGGATTDESGREVNKEA